ncbi:Uncharacterised protein [Mycobacteroides abscessus subsp. abscessus]|nr:Uncharacterised protein [Mycobacteroides abscessus subsp. abscessus]
MDLGAQVGVIRDHRVQQIRLRFAREVQHTWGRCGDGRGTRLGSEGK